ncbi:MAG: hypothetical protein Terrestrivirus2_68 [Terrestrivirus sp.]|uniref:Zinc-ribbon domain-containing protein n=1 Tax=Terrestrivirus sp. TaxID=2487775 RepID=A0A3G4ZL34_9VIRU|nr:MAG: hypothetical protein Terrestrivirus2_68 [Terrestrivirus sp.]
MKNKYTLQDCINWAKEKEGECLSTEYTTANEYIKWKCKCGYEWKAPFCEIKYRGSWCRKCAHKNLTNKKKKTINDAHKLAKDNDGYCLSELFVNIHEKLEWKCINNHVWKMPYTKVQEGKWCAKCSRSMNRKEVNIDRVNDIVNKKGGKCLSTVCNSVKDILEFECKNGHNWKTITGSILYNDSWCGKCLLTTLDDCKKIAKEKEGECLSTEYKSETNSKLEWKCKFSHVWTSKFNSIKSGHWCPTCAKKCITLEDCINVAKLQNGICLSTKCLNAKDKIEWKCNNGHTWLASYDNISRGRWCPFCKDYRYIENICRDIFESIFNKKFISIRPNWLKNETNYNLEIDVYNEELNIACEYNGRQHYKYIQFFHKTKEEFTNQQARDKLKYKLINEKGIKLIIIPYTVKKNDIFDYIVGECNKLNIILPNSNNLNEIKEIIHDKYVK